MFDFKRSPENPILVPDSDNEWEKEVAFNGCPVAYKNKIAFVYRAVSSAFASSVGFAMSDDGVHFENRKQFIKPEYDWERFGCEDPRVTKFGDKYYIFYTALSVFPFSADGIRVGVAITKDFKKIEEKHLVTPFNAKAMVLFPERINGKIAVLLTVNTDKPPARVCLALFDEIEQIWSREYWEEWYASLNYHALPLERSPQDQVEVGAPPIKTKHGWIVLYSYIKNYFSPPPVFGVEAVLLDLKNPAKISARTLEPFLTPRDVYEKYGAVPNIIFPTGAIVHKDKLHLYYGAADTVCALATTDMKKFMKEMLALQIDTLGLERFPGNPIMKADVSHSWESKAVFNPGAIYAEGKNHLVYRAMSGDNTSVFGYASSVDGFKINERLAEPIYVPREDFEKKRIPGSNSGCEDPRLTKIGDTIYMCYTAYNGVDAPRVALTSIKYVDFINKRWNWAMPILISPPGVDDKDAAIFPKKIGGKFAILHRIGISIWLDFVDDLNFSGEKWLCGKILMSPRLEKGDSKKIGIACPPIETDAGWLVIYHGISQKPDHHYHLRAALLDSHNPSKVIVRTKYPIFETETSYEKYGIVQNVVFSNGATLVGNKLFVYYGGADTVIGVATIELSDLLKRLIAESKKRRKK